MILVLQPDPVGGSAHAGHPHLVQLALEVVAAVPATDPQLRGPADVQRRAGAPLLTRQPAIDVESRTALLVGVGHVRPGAERNPAPAAHVAIGEITVHRDVRRAAELHHHLALRLFVAPGEHPDVGLLGTKPGLAAMRFAAGRIGFDSLSARQPLAGREPPRQADDARRRTGSLVLELQGTRGIGDVGGQMPDAQIAVVRVEDPLRVGRAGSIRPPPIHPQRVPRLALDPRHAHPDARLTPLGIPVVDLEGERSAVGIGKADVGAVGSRLGEGKEIAMQSHQQRKLLDHRPGRQRRAVVRGQHVDPAGMFPARIVAGIGRFRPRCFAKRRHRANRRHEAHHHEPRPGRHTHRNDSEKGEPALQSRLAGARIDAGRQHIHSPGNGHAHQRVPTRLMTPVADHRDTPTRSDTSPVRALRTPCWPTYPDRRGFVSRATP